MLPLRHAATYKHILYSLRYRPRDLHRENAVALLQAFARKTVGMGVTCIIQYDATQ